jgi:hypothetical protein
MRTQRVVANTTTTAPRLKSSASPIFFHGRIINFETMGSGIEISHISVRTFRA